MKVLVAVALVLVSAFSILAQTQAEITVQSTFLRKAPTSTAEKLQTLQKGEKLNIEKSQDTNGWYYVSTVSGKIKGWVNGNTITTTIASGESSQTKSNQNPQIGSQNRQVDNQPQTAVSTTAPKTDPPPPTNETPQEDNEVLRIDTEEISLNVRVLDVNKRPVGNLNKAQFQVYEDDIPQEITSLTTAEVPMNYALLVDNSRSLRSQLPQVAEAGKIIVSTNRPMDASTVVRFVSADKIEVVQDFTKDSRRLNEALDNLFVEGGQTAIIDAIFSTAKKVDQYEKSGKKDDIRRRALILVSDGDDRSSTHNEQELFDLLRASDVQVYAIGFVNNLKNEEDANGINRQEKAKAFLTRLAAETGGKVYFPDSVNELPQIANNISGELRTQYLLTYAPTTEKGGGAYRNIKVTIADGANNEKRTAITRSGRTSGSEEKPKQPAQQNPVRKP